MARQSVSSGRGAAAQGIIGRAMERAFENPAASGGLLVMALTAGAIAVNATFLQPGGHRASAVPRASPERTAPAVPPVPEVRPTDGASALTPATATSAADIGAVIAGTTLSDPGLKALPAGKPALAAPTAATTTPDATLVADTQRQLGRLGLYNGKIDGVAGSHTKAAIATYQRSAGLPATGIASRDLLAQMQVPPAKPAPASLAQAPALVPPKPIPTAASATIVATAAPATASAASTVATSDAYSKVQLALNRAGYGLIPVDGKPGKETADAIRRFELDNGLPVTGRPSDALLQRLVTIGALASG